ncbi:tyrosine-type recombinase/integrase [Rhizobium aethiopicum]|nr:tyrosine-type recombinase/integrase [Rhizobium aethiopicum]
MAASRRVVSFDVSPCSSHVRRGWVEGRAHGLRKTLAQLLAESGNSNSELNARFGWRSDAMANHYTRKADKKRLAVSGAAKKR